MRSQAILPAILLLHAALATAAESADPAKPNVLILYADDLGYGDVQCYNPERGKIPTPNIDKIASQGMRFTDGHSSSGVCSPSRYTLLTGRYHWRSRLQRGIVGLWEEPLIAPDRLTLGSLAKQHGYRTACIGKWHLGWDWPIPEDRAALFKERPKGETAATDAHRAVWRDVFSQPIAESANKPEPFLLYLPLTSPHTPLSVNEEWKGKSGLGLYADFVMETDAVIGRVLAALDESGAADNTLVVFTSDNGCATYIGVKELEKQGHFPSGPLRSYKTSVMEGGHRVPFLVRWPGRVKPGTVSQQLVQQADLMATFADILGAKLPDNAGEDSFSLLPLLDGKDLPVRPHAVNCAISGVPGLREGPWKFIPVPDPESKAKDKPPVQLYHLAEDLGETNNLAASMPEKVTEMQALLETVVANGRSSPGPKQPNDMQVVRHQ